MENFYSLKSQDQINREVMGLRLLKAVRVAVWAYVWAMVALGTFALVSMV